MYRFVFRYIQVIFSANDRYISFQHVQVCFPLYTDYFYMLMTDIYLSNTYTFVFRCIQVIFT
jgi:hypothetical protein